MLRFAILFVLLLTACAAPQAIVTAPDEPARPIAPSEDILPESAGDEGGYIQTAPASSDIDFEGQLHPGTVIVDDDFVIIYDEIENTGQHWLHNIQIVATYYDVAGKDIYQDKVPAEILFAGPDERSPFYVVTDKARMQGNYASHKIQYSREVNDIPGYSLDVSFVDNGITFFLGEITGAVRLVPLRLQPWLLSKTRPRSSRSWVTDPIQVALVEAGFAATCFTFTFSGEISHV